MTGRHVSDPCTLTILDPLYSPYVHVSSGHTPSTKCIVLLIEMSSKSPGFLECQPRCLHLTVVNASHSQRTCKSHFRCLLVSITPGTVYQPQCKQLSFKITVSSYQSYRYSQLVPVQTEQFSSFSHRWLFNKALGLPLSIYGLPVLLKFPARPDPDYSPGKPFLTISNQNTTELLLPSSIKLCT